MPQSDEDFLREPTKKLPPKEAHCLDYYSGGVPSLLSFLSILEDLRRLSDESSDRNLDRIRELCLIGLVAYFESFCKDHFASLINIEPDLIANLSDNKQDTSIDAVHVVAFGERLDHKIGFLLAEKYDFGTAQKINSLFSALIKITPFSKDEGKRFSQILNERNLLVHHGGTFTVSFAQQAGIPLSAIPDRAHWASWTGSKQDLLASVDFVEAIARKMARASHAALSRYVEEHGKEYSPERKRALDGILWEMRSEGVPEPSLCE